jgi:phospholipid/cholesterol/gamma-HCH transport system substrate-binding protein
MNRRIVIFATATALVVVMVIGAFVAFGPTSQARRVHVTGYFANSNGIFAGDEVRIMGVPVGKIDRIEPQGTRVKIKFWYDSKYSVPADANAVVMSPSLVSVRAIQLTPTYNGGPQMRDGAVISDDRTAVPIEWDDFREQLQKLTQTLQPTEPGGVSSLGAFVNTAADNLRGQGANIRDTLIKLSAAFSALGDHSTDLFSTVKNVSLLVSALASITDLMRSLNVNLAAATALLSNGPNEVGAAVAGINDVVSDVKTFIDENRETLGTTSEKVSTVSTALTESLDDLKQTLHVAPTTFSNFINIYQPSQGGLTGALAINNFANPISFICSAIQAASRLNSEQSAKLCVQYLAPIVKNRQYNFLPLGENLIVGQTARPNELTYSEDWLRPDYVPPPGPETDAPQQDSSPLAAEAPLPPGDTAPTPAAETQSTNPDEGLPGLMVPHGGGS